MCFCTCALFWIVPAHLHEPRQHLGIPKLCVKKCVQSHGLIDHSDVLICRRQVVFISSLVSVMSNKYRMKERIGLNLSSFMLMLLCVQPGNVDRLCVQLNTFLLELTIWPTSDSKVVFLRFTSSTTRLNATNQTFTHPFHLSKTLFFDRQKFFSAKITLLKTSQSSVCVYPHWYIKVSFP